MSVLTRDSSQHSESRSHRVAPAFERQPYDILRVKVIRILCEARTRRMLNPLINRQDRNVTAAAEPPMLINALKIDQHAVVAIG